MDFTSIGLAVLRIGVSATLFLQHGLPKLMRFSEMVHTFPDPLGAGSAISLVLVTAAEAFCTLFIIIGLFTRAFVIPPLIAMLVAFFVIHAADPFAKKELALLYALPLFCLLCSGAGRYSLDRYLRGK